MCTDEHTWQKRYKKSLSLLGISCHKRLQFKGVTEIFIHENPFLSLLTRSLKRHSTFLLTWSENCRGKVFFYTHRQRYILWYAGSASCLDGNCSPEEDFFLCNNSGRKYPIFHCIPTTTFFRCQAGTRGEVSTNSLT